MWLNLDFGNATDQNYHVSDQDYHDLEHGSPGDDYEILLKLRPCYCLRFDRPGSLLVSHPKHKSHHHRKWREKKKLGNVKEGKYHDREVLVCFSVRKKQKIFNCVWCALMVIYVIQFVPNLCAKYQFLVSYYKDINNKTKHDINNKSYLNCPAKETPHRPTQHPYCQTIQRQGRLHEEKKSLPGTHKKRPHPKT